MDYWSESNLERERNKFMLQSKVVEYDKGEIICSEGDDCVAIRYLSKGCLLAYRGVGSSMQKVVAPIFPGKTMNVADLIAGQSQVSLKAATKSIVYELSPDDFTGLADDPGFLRWCMWAVSQNAVALSEFGALLRMGEVPARFLALLRLIHFQQTGRREKANFSIEWPLSQQAVAEILSVSRPYASEIIGQLVENNTIRFEGSRVHVVE